MNQAISTIRAFLSIDIDNPVLVTKLIKIQERIDTPSAKIKMVEPQNIHFTLRFLGNTHISELSRIHEQLKTISFSPFSIKIGTVGAFPSIRRPNIIWAGIIENQDKVKNLKMEIDDKLIAIAYPPDRKFKPHITIARVKSVHNREKLVSNLESLRRESVGTMIVTSFKMKKSTLTPHGPIYETLWEIPAI